MNAATCASTARADVNMGDLTGTELEKAETELFRRAFAEGVRATMWLGDTEGAVSDFTTFDGFLKAIKTAHDASAEGMAYTEYSDGDFSSVADMLDMAWLEASPELRSLRSEGSLVYFITSDLRHGYESELDSKGVDSAYRESIDGRQSLCYHGIPVVEVPLSKYEKRQRYAGQFCLLTDRRNMILALNTADMPENEVRMWYNPDEVENRQRAVFLAGTEVLDPRLVSICVQSQE